ncbi:JmjC domain-containing protein [Bdellovibrio bacteriovorus]|uniref:JmjC domain-containing protein n=1 Tax=Bdellovibrio bacteriovorus TaxID=959 RepID=UPI0035A6C935
MSILEELLSPLTLSEFQTHYFQREAFAAPFKASFLKNTVSWSLLNEIFLSRHRNCWLPKAGCLPDEPHLNTGLLNYEQARQGFVEGRTVLVRHAEEAHPLMTLIGTDFKRLFNKPIDIQLYCTPAQQQGFDWHYDIEDVFVIQSAGEKEFHLRRNTVSEKPYDLKKQNADFMKEPRSQEIRCWLKAGDWLYIPAGYWHKAHAITDSYHLSVGVLTTAPSPH